MKHTSLVSHASLPEKVTEQDYNISEYNYVVKEKVQGMQMITVTLKMVPSFTCSTKCFFKLSSDVLKFRFFTKRDRDWIMLKVKPKKLIENIRNDYKWHFITKHCTFKTDNFDGTKHTLNLKMEKILLGGGNEMIRPWKMITKQIIKLEKEYLIT